MRWDAMRISFFLILIYTVKSRKYKLSLYKQNSQIRYLNISKDVKLDYEK